MLNNKKMPLKTKCKQIDFIIKKIINRRDYVKD